MKTLVARRRAAAATAGLTAAALLVGGLAGASSAAPERTAATSVDTTYLSDTLGLPTQTVVETITYDRFQWLLQQPGQFAFVVGSPSESFKTKVQAADLAAKAAGVSKLYWFDPNLSGYTGTKNLDTRNPSGITSIGSASQVVYGNTWKNLVAQYLGNGIKATGAGTGTITTEADNTVVNDAVDPLWDYRSEPETAPVASSDDVFFVYDRGHLAGGVADKIVGGVNLTTTSDVSPAITSVLTTVGGANIDRLDQFEWWKAENNRRLAAANEPERYGTTVLDATDNTGGWNVQQLTYPELLHVLDVNEEAANFVLLFGGTWCPNTRAVIKDVNKQAKANEVTVYNFDTVLDGGVVGGGTTSASNPLQIRNNATYQGTTNYVPSFLYGDLVRKYLRNVVTEYDPNTGTRVLYYPGGDTTVAPDVVRRLQVPFLVNYQRGTGNNPSSTAVKRQWIQQNVDASTGLPTFKEYMSQFWFTNPQGTRIGLSTTQLPSEITTIPTDPANAPDNAFLTTVEQALPEADRTPLVAQRRSAVTTARANEAFGQEAIAGIKHFFGGAPGAVVSTQTVTATKVTYGTAPKVAVTIENPYGRIPAGNVTLSVAGKSYVATVAQNAVSFTLPKLVPGNYGFTVTYAGDDQVLGFQKSGTLSVAKAKVSSTTGAAVKAPTTKKAGSYRVTVTTPAGLAKASGKATVTLTKGATKRTINGTVSNGSVTVKVPKLAKGTWKSTVSYAGNANYVAAKASGKSFTVKKAKAKAKVKKVKAKKAKKR